MSNWILYFLLILSFALNGQQIEWVSASPYQSMAFSLNETSNGNYLISGAGDNYKAITAQFDSNGMFIHQEMLSDDFSKGLYSTEAWDDF